ncbi:MAG: YidC/Oxa1 family membrane protein insertase [Erysipelotrichaceae bacterium]|nr:YidC/Oxa1 family membrane protein insertase [Erysipelotrichaceae bacterium]
MSNKRFIRIISVILLAFVLTGCQIATNPDGSIKLIYLTTTFREMMEEGVFSAILIYPLAQSINFLDKYIGVGGAVMIVTLLLNAAILALTFKSNVSMQRMQELQPEMNKIQKKYEGRDDEASKQRMSMEMTKLYQKYDVNPMGALLTTFIQFPVIIAMYNAVRRSAAVANGIFLGIDLSQTPLEAFKAGQYGALVIYALMIVMQLLSILAPRFVAERKAKREAKLHHKTYRKPENNQNMMMSYSMILFIGVLMISWPTALSLYYMIFSVVNIIKTFAIDQLMVRQQQK